MIDPRNFPFCSEFYVVERVIEVVVSFGDEQKRVRIEALKAKSGDYCTHGYIQHNVKLQSDFGDEEIKTTIWIPYDHLPWTSGPTPDVVLRQALSFLGERCSKNST